MKSFIFLLNFIIVSISFAQYGLGPNEHILQAGAGVGRMEGDMFQDELLPHLNLSYEYVIDESFSCGGFISYGVSYNQTYFPSTSISKSSGRNQHSFTKYDSSVKYEYFIFGGRSSLHFYSDEVFDTYLSALLGIDIGTASSDYWGQMDDEKPTKLFYGGMLGMRIFFNEQFGAFAEAGYGIGYINAGLFLRFW